MDIMSYVAATMSAKATTVASLTFIIPSKKDKKEKDNKCKFSKSSAPLPLPFSGETKDWPQWKRQKRCAMGMVGLLQALEDGECAFNHPDENQTACHMLENAVAAGNASSVFSTKVSRTTDT